MSVAVLIMRFGLPYTMYVVCGIIAIPYGIKTNTLLYSIDFGFWMGIVHSSHGYGVLFDTFQIV